MLTAFIPFHDCDVSMGTITMVDGSHRWRNRGAPGRDGKAAQEPSDLQREGLLSEISRRNGAKVAKVPMTIPKGHATFHHCLLYHGSSANRSDRPRRAISLHMQDGDNRYRDFQQSRDARQQPYKHDELVRRDAKGDPDYADPEFCPALWPA